MRLHRQAVVSLYWGLIGVAWLFTLQPGSIMHEVVFGTGLGILQSAIPQVTGIAAAVVYRRVSQSRRRQPVGKELRSLVSVARKADVSRNWS